MAPELILSIKPAMVVIGVRRSCDTLARKVFRIFSRLARDSAIWLKAVASSETSSLPYTGTRAERSPFAKLLVAAVMLRRG